MKKITAVFIALLVVQLLAAIIAAPHSCEWGNTAYFFTGIACLLAAVIVSLLQKQWPLSKRLLTALLLSALLIVLWIAAFLLLDFRIICRLF